MILLKILTIGTSISEYVIYNYNIRECGWVVDWLSYHSEIVFLESKLYCKKN